MCDMNIFMRCLNYVDVDNALVEWYFNGIKLKEGVELSFEYLAHENEGLYECEARNSLGADRRSIQVQLEDGDNDDGDYGEDTARPHQHHSNRSINIQVLSNPQTDHVENGRVKIKCISDIESAIYVWTLVNGTFSKDVRVDGDTLTLEPFTRESAGVYRCLAYNVERNEQASRRININIESSAPRYVVDITHKMTIDMVSPVTEMRKGGTVKLKCSVGKAFSTHFYFYFQNFFKYLLTNVNFIFRILIIISFLCK